MENTNQPAQQEDKTAAILAYITLIGYIVAIVMNSNNKTKIGSYHLKQATGLLLTSIALWFLIMVIAFLPFIGFTVLFLSPVLWILILVLVILGVINAANGAMKPLPLVGPMFEKLFANAFN